MAGHKLPPEYWHRDRQRQQGQAQPPIEKPLLGLAYSDSSVIESAVVRFSFKKAGTSRFFFSQDDLIIAPPSCPHFSVVLYRSV